MSLLLFRFIWKTCINCVIVNGWWIHSYQCFIKHNIDWWSLTIFNERPNVPNWQKSLLLKVKNFEKRIENINTYTFTPKTNCCFGLMIKSNLHEVETTSWKFIISFKKNYYKGHLHWRISANLISYIWKCYVFLYRFWIGKLHAPVGSWTYDLTLRLALTMKYHLS